MSGRIEFKPVSREPETLPKTPSVTPSESIAPSEPESEPDLPQMAPSEPLTLRLASEEEAQRAIFEFLASLYAGQPMARQALLVTAEQWRRLGEVSHAEWQRALGYCVNAMLLEIGPDVSAWRAPRVPAAIWPLIWLLHNTLVPARGQNAVNAINEFNAALLEMIPPARTLPDMLLYHGVLHHALPSFAHANAYSVPLWQALLTRSPLTALYCLDWHTPPALTPLAAQRLPGGSRYEQPCLPWISPDAWLNAVTLLLAEPRLARFLHQRWLALPENQASCRNMGLLLDALRRRGGHDAFLLRFYEQYAYTFRSQNWPLLAEIERFLRFAPRDYGNREHNDNAALTMNRGGNERFLKFWPLLQLVRTEGDIILRDYRHLPAEFYLALERLARWASVKG